MSTRKHRPLSDLYNVTPTILKPQITPVLSGSYRMQGPLYEADPDSQTNTASSQVDQESHSSSMNQKVSLGVESEKCNVCSSPCSSCLHIQQALMGSKLDESTGEANTENALSCSVNDPSTNKSSIGQTGQHIELGNELGVNPNCDSFCENEKQKASSRICDVSAASGSGALLQKVDCSRVLEVLDDNVSCVISSDKHSNSSEFRGSNGDGINLQCCPASESRIVPEGHAKALDQSTSSGCMDIKCDAEDIQESSGWHSRSGEESLRKVPLSTSSATSPNSGLVEILQRNRDDAYHSVKEGQSIPHVQESNEDSCTPLQGELLECQDEHFNPSFTKEVVSDDPCGEPTADASRQEKEDMEKSKKSSVLPDKRDSSHSDPMDESDDSDIVEQDVKVCDICGDAGREDLLAVCSRCSDGAEHTYCMRETLSKVPEGDWMCEECQYDEEMENQRQDKISRDHSPIKILGKRRRDDVEVSSSAKKPAVEAGMKSPKKSSLSSVASLSRDNSFRHTEKGKEKLSEQSSSGALVVGDDTELARAPATGSQTRTPQGTFLKSNSFSSSNVKPKVKLVDEVVPLKQKMVREPSPVDLKEGIGKSLGKSTSFRNMTSGRLTTGEAKVKMLSPRFSQNQDNKGPKHTKERSVFERKSSFKSERPPLNSPRNGSAISSPKSDQKPVCRGEKALSSISNNHLPKAVQPDRKSSTLSKPSSLVSRRGSDISISLGDVKRQSALANGCSSSEEKPSPKVASLLISHVSEKPTSNSNEILPDETSYLRESANMGEKMRDNGGRSRQNVAVGGRTDICHKCKEVGHLTQFCMVEGLPSDLSAAKSLREVTNGSNDLKAAIEAARLRKPGIYRKHRVPDQSNDLSLASKNNQLASQDQSLCSSIRKNASPEKANAKHSAVSNSIDSCKQAAIDNAKQYMTETSTSTTGDGSVVPFDGKTSMGDLSSHLSATISVFWKVLALPEHEFIWQGHFEVHRTLKVEFCDGIQAHLSTCASPKVLGAVNKFPKKIVLNEVPRLNTWPIQFQEFGVREDNIALYFFAKDVDSYEKSYKNLLENMIKNDLALKGAVDGAELLIFPSTQLPEKSQRWNMLFFLWGVFRGKKSSCLQQMPCSPKQLSTLGEIPTAIMSLPENICSVRPTDRDLSSVAAIIAEVPAAKEGDGDGASRIPPLARIGGLQQVNVAQQDGGVDSDSLPILSGSTKSCKESRCTGIDLEAGADSSGKLGTGEVQASVQAPGGTEKMASPGSIAKEIVSDKISNNIYQANHGNNLGDESARVEAHLRRDIITGEPIMQDPNSRHLINSKLSHEESSAMTSAVAPAGTSQPIKINYDDKSEDVIVADTSKRQKTGSDGLYGINDESRSSIDSFALPRHGLALDSPVLNIGAEPCGGTAQPDSGNAERHFFPIDPHPVKDIGLPWKVLSLEDQLHERTPNLELALGGETKPQGFPSFLVGKVDKKVIQENHSDKVVANDGGEDDVTASLSLSLSFPFPEKEKNVPTTPKPDQLTAERQPVDNSLLLFGSLRDK